MAARGRARPGQTEARRKAAGQAAPGPATALAATSGHRRAGDAVAGAAAVVLLLVLIAGVPLALIGLFGLPVPHTMPSMALLTHQLDLLTILRVCSVVVWLAWLQLMWCVIAEVRAAVRNAGMPARVPLAGGTQALVHRLVTAALLLLSAATALTPAFASHGGPRQVSAAPQHPGGAGTGSGAGGTGLAGQGAYLRGDSGGAGSGAADGQGGGGPAAGHDPGRYGSGPDPALGAPGAAGPGAAGHQPAGLPARLAGGQPASPQLEKIYVVNPPEGRYHESLWEIAQNHLGDGRRYQEIFELNDGRIQPDGTRLTMASLIRPGWILRMPRDAHGPGIEVVSLAPGEDRLRGAHPDQAPAAPRAAQQEAAQQEAQQEAQQRETQQRDVQRQQAQRQEEERREEERRKAQSKQAEAPQAEAPQAEAPQAEAPQEPRQAPHHQAGHPLGGQQHARGPGGPGQQAPAPATSAPATSAPATSAPATSAPAIPGAPAPGSAAGAPAPQAHLPVYPFELAAASLLAAGVLSALGRRRREQLWHRAFGRKVVAPEGDAAVAESALRLGEAPAHARMLDTGLRYLCHALAQQGRTPPTVFAAHVGADNLDLWVAPADLDAPPPWAAVGDGQVWRLPYAVVPGLDAEHVTAPYPGLVSVGTDATGRVLVDLESARGLIAVTGPDPLVRAALAAMAAELATSRWADGMDLTLVGFGAELAVLAPGRVRAVGTLAQALPALEAHAAEVAEALSDSGAGSVLAGRASGLSPRAWAPHYLITAVPPTAAERDRLLTLAAAAQGAAGYLAAGDVPGATWTWEVTPDGRLRAGPLGFDLAAPLLLPEQRAAVAELFQAAGEPVGVPLSAPLADAAPAGQLDPAARAPVEVTLLGPVSVRAPGTVEPDRLAAATEVVVYLATHPGGVHPNVLAGAIWPRGVTSEVRDALIGRVRDWLGTDGIGRPHLATDASGRLRLGSAVRVDWQVFCALLARAGQALRAGQAGAGQPGPAGDLPAGPGAGGRAQEASWLTRALHLVGGQLLDGRAPGRYAWLATDGLEYEATARVADAAHRLCELRLAAGQPQQAMGAARAGLRLAFNDELLWRDLLTAAHATGEEDVLRSVAGEICARTALDEVLPRMAPETEALIDELLPSWRSSAA